MNHIMLAKQEKARYNNMRIHVLQYPGVCQFFILACICADAFTLFSVFDLILTQQMGITWVITITVAAAINIAPMLLAANLRNEELTKASKATICTFLAVLFIVLFVVTFSLRYASQEQLFGSSSELNIVVSEEYMQNETTIEETFEPTVAQRILAIILGLEPCATSICSFVLSYEVSPERKRRHLGNMQIIKLEEDIVRCKVMLEGLKNDLEFDIEEYDRELYEEFQAILIQKGELVKNMSIRKLSEHDGTPEGVSYLMEGEFLEKHEVVKTNDSVSVSIVTDDSTAKSVRTIA